MAVELLLLEDKPDPNPETQFFTGGVDAGTNIVDLGISTTLQTGDVLLVMHGAEGAQNTQPAPGSGNVHPSAISITTITAGSGTNPSWTDFGYQRGGENGGNVNNRNNIGAFCCVIGANDNKSNFTVRLSFTDTIRQQRRTVRLYCLRGVDTTNFSSLGTIARTSARSQAELAYHAWTRPNALQYNQSTVTDDFMAIFSTSVRQTGTITTAPVPSGFTRIEPLGFPNDATGSPPSSWQNWDVFGNGTTATIACYSTGTTYRHWTYFKPYTSFSGFNITNFYAMDHSATDHNGGASLLLLFPAVASGSEFQRPQVDHTTSEDTLDSVQSGTAQVSDSGSATDSLVAVKQSALDVVDPAGSADTLDTLQAGAFTASDSATVVDTEETLQSGSVTFTDSVNSADSLAAEKTKIFDVTDSVTTTDSLEDIQSGTYSVSDSGSAGDTLTVEQQGAVDFTDSAEATDEIGELQTGPEFLSSNGSAVDSLETVQFSAVQFTDTASVVDDADLVKSTAQNTDFDETDGSSATDSLDTTQEGQSSNTDGTSGTDTLSAEKQTNLSATDSATATDSLDAVLSANFNAQDSGSASDTLETLGQKNFAVSDGSETTDSINLIRTINVEFVDPSEGTSVFAGQVDHEIILVDTGSATDDITAEGPEVTTLTVVISGVGTVQNNLMTGAQALEVKNIWNVALNALGIATVQSTQGSSPQQTLLNNVFPLFRKQFLSDHLWNGAKKTTDLTALTVNSTDQAVANRWKYVYQLPTDCMRVWRLNGQENKPVHVGGNANIYTNRWEIEVVEVSSTKHRALCTNEDEARIEYVFDVENDVALLGPLTQHAMGMALAAFVATNFGKSASEIAQLEAQAKEAITAAKGVDGQEGTPQMFGDTSLLGVRSIGY